MKKQNEYDHKQHSKRRGRSTHARSTCYVTCPFCGVETMAYIWSMAGGGKKCDGCPAVHGGMGYSSLKKSK